MKTYSEEEVKLSGDIAHELGFLIMMAFDDKKLIDKHNEIANKLLKRLEDVTGKKV